jgi:hypothetical protein
VPHLTQRDRQGHHLTPVEGNREELYALARDHIRIR